MIMQDNEKKPALRFKGFTDPWEQRKLSELTSMHARIGWQNLRTSEFLDSGDYMLITGTDFDDGTVNYSTCHFVERERYEQDKNIQIRNGSILITKDGTLGKVAYVQGLSMPATLNAGVFNVEIRNTSIVDERYLFQYLKAPFLMDYVDKKATGGTIKHLNQNILVDFPVVMPKKTEQVSIGNFFQRIDTLITLHQRKYEKLVNIKKSMLDKMFPKNGASVPEIRFKGFTDPWEQRKLGELSRSFEYGLNAAAKEYDGQNKYLRITDIDDTSRQFVSADITSPDANLAEADNYRLSDGDVLFARTGASVGKTYLYKKSDGLVYFAGFLIRAKIKESVSAGFIFQNTLTRSYERYIAITSQRSGQPGVNAQEYAEYQLMLPELFEQEKIAKLLEALDTLITLHQRKLEKLQNIKKSCLEKMFV